MRWGPFFAGQSWLSFDRSSRHLPNRCGRLLSPLHMPCPDAAHPMALPPTLLSLTPPSRRRSCTPSPSWRSRGPSPHRRSRGSCTWEGGGGFAAFMWCCSCLGGRRGPVSPAFSAVACGWGERRELTRFILLLLVSWRKDPARIWEA